MSQTLQVLKCYRCNTFQVQIKKKSNRWVCKICEEKQSLTKIYGEGSGKDCRLHVQKLNQMRGILEDEKRESMWDSQKESPEPGWDDDYEEVPQQASVSGGVKRSKWDCYLEDDPQEVFDNTKGSEINVKEDIFESQLQEQDQKTSPITYSNYPVDKDMLRFDDKYSTPQPASSRNAERKNAPVGSTESRYSKFVRSKEFHAAEDNSPSTVNVNKDKSCQAMSEIKSQKLFCATKTEELDEILKL